MIQEKYINNINEISINVVNSEVESVRKKDITKTGFRVYDKGCIGTSGAIGAYDEKKLIDKAKESLNQNISYAFEPCKNKTMNIDASKEIINRNDFLNEAEEILSYLRKNHPDFSFSNKIQLVKSNTSLNNNSALNLNYDDSCLIVELIYKEKSSSNIMDGGISLAGRSYDRNIFLNYSHEVLNAYKNMVELPSEKKYPVVFTSSNFLPIKKFTTDLNGKMYGSGGSLFSGKIGEKLFSKDFTLYQTLNHKDTLLQPFFDAEGVVNQNSIYSLIENGILKTPYTDKKTSHMFNLPLTGSAVCDYDGVPFVGPIDFKIKECEKTIKELLGGEQGILVIIESGGDFTPDGNFGAPVQLSMMFDGEKLIGRLPEIQLSSNIFNMFGRDFRGVSKDTVLPIDSEHYIVMDMNVSKM